MQARTIGQLIVIPVDSQEQRSACYALRAAQYGRHYRNIPSTEFSDEFDTTVSLDGSRISQLFGAYRDGSLVGTCRLVRSINPSSASVKSEVFELFDLRWDHLADIAGISTDELSVCELGKFAVAEGEDSREIKWTLLSSSGKFALDLGIQVVVAIMPPTVERAARHAGVFFNRLNDVKLRRDDNHRKRYLIRYHDYFLPMLRKAGLDIDCEHLECVDPIVLDMLLSGVSDGPALWWIRSRDLANSRLPSKGDADLK